MSYVSLNELKMLEIDGLPKTIRGLAKLAERQKWKARKKQGKGGGFEYIPSYEIQTAIKQKQAVELLASAQPAQLPSVIQKKQAPARRKLEQLGIPLNEYADGLTDKQRDCAHARMAIVAEVLKMHDVAGLKITAAVDYVVRQIEQGLLPEPLAGFVPVANARANSKRGISVRTLKEWVSLYRGAGSPTERLTALAPAKTNKTRSLHEIVWLEDWLRVWCNPNKLSLPMAYKAFATAYVAQHGADACPSL